MVFIRCKQLVDFKITRKQDNNVDNNVNQFTEINGRYTRWTRSTMQLVKK